uniref:Uncharacterized protein MANES_15G177100 n=2 Tax=Rhizophora mucronata TaxID=61149 RepID=A0A2P2L1I5_RHIMU
MCPGGYTIEVTSLSPKATEEDVYDFFAHCGAIQHVEIIRSGEYACTAYVTFIDGYALQTAILLSGATIVDQQVCVTPWITQDNDGSSGIHVSQFVSTPGEAVTVAQEVVKTMMAKGYVLGKDALFRAKAFDESHHLSATAVAKVAEISKNIGLTDKINAGKETVKYVDEKYHVFDITKSTASVTGTAAVAVARFTGKTAMAAGHAFVNSSYFAKGAFWVSDVLTRAAQAAADLGNKAGK